MITHFIFKPLILQKPLVILFQSKMIILKFQYKVPLFLVDYTKMMKLVRRYCSQSRPRKIRSWLSQAGYNCLNFHLDALVFVLRDILVHCLRGAGLFNWRKFSLEGAAHSQKGCWGVFVLLPWLPSRKLCCLHALHCACRADVLLEVAALISSIWPLSEGRWWEGWLAPGLFVIFYQHSDLIIYSIKTAAHLFLMEGWKIYHRVIEGHRRQHKYSPLKNLPPLRITRFHFFYTLDMK